jgi:hypothetical protein
MMIAAPHVEFLWPLWLTGTHVIAISTLCYKLENKQPTLNKLQFGVIALGWLSISITMFIWMRRVDPDFIKTLDRAWIAPFAAVVLFLPIAIRIVRSQPAQRPAGRSLMKWGLLWLIVYDACWIIGYGLYMHALRFAILLLLAVFAMKIIRLRLEREKSHIGFPLG